MTDTLLKVRINTVAKTTDKTYVVLTRYILNSSGHVRTECFTTEGVWEERPNGFSYGQIDKHEVNGDVAVEQEVSSEGFRIFEERAALIDRIWNDVEQANKAGHDVKNYWVSSDEFELLKNRYEGLCAPVPDFYSEDNTKDLHTFVETDFGKIMILVRGDA